MEGGGPMKGVNFDLLNSLGSNINYYFKNLQPQGPPIFCTENT